MGGLFSYARIEGFPTMFPEKKTPVTEDVLEVGWILAFVILAFTFYLVLPGIHGKARLFYFLWFTLSLFIGATIIIGNFGQEWEVSQVTAVTPYKAGSPAEITANIGMKLGLRSVNITLKRAGDVNESDPLTLPHETINYNERFTWTWDQGRFGFGPYAGRFQQEFREGQLKGLPLPILWVADYFIMDGEGVRFGRYYRTAGWYAHIAMWAAFPCWLLANILFMLEPRYGGYFTALTGGLELLACVLWSVIRNPLPLSIPFNDKEMTTIYGSSFWLILFSGLLSLFLGILVIVMDLLYPDETTIFFGNDPLTVYDESYNTAAENAECSRRGPSNDIHMTGMMVKNPEYINSDKHHVTQVILKRRSTFRNAQRMLIRRPPAPPPCAEDENPIYLNVEQPGTSYGSRNKLYNN